jgi:rhodanese-related sulfurtransferase
MIKQLPSKDLTNFIKDNPKSVLLDVRTKEEWDQIGKPDGELVSRLIFCLLFSKEDCQTKILRRNLIN